MAEVTAVAPAAPILLVEDDPTTVDVVRAYLEHEGHTTAVCRSGGQALDVLRQVSPRCAVQAFMAVTGTLLTVLTIAGQMPPALLLIFTFLLGTGSVLSLPAYQSLVPELVPRAQITQAATLSAVSVNLARAVGPAVAGLLIARTGAATVFAVNAAAFLAYGVVVTLWHPPVSTRTQHPEPFVAALRAGGRYVRHAPVVRRVLLRSAFFLVPGIALWALLPLVATDRLDLGAGGYGLLLAALGIGAVAGSFSLGRLRGRLSTNTLLVASSCLYAAVMVVVVTVDSLALALVVLLLAGVAWIAVLSSFNATLQLFLPAWVRARGISAYLMVMFGSQALGAVLWGAVSALLSLTPTFLTAAGVMLATTTTIRLWPLYDTRGMDRRPTALWPEAEHALQADPDSGPVLVLTTYAISEDKIETFLDLMSKVRLSRLRTGAVQWSLYRDGESEHRFVELFVVGSWDEHLRQHADRYTGFDTEIEDQVTALSDPPPSTSHYIATRPAT